jgi:O-antigen ligase
MNLARLRYRMGIINHKIEFFFILGWTLFYPQKENPLYFLGFALLMCLILLKNIYFMKTIGLSYFSHFLAIFNFIFILSGFFSTYVFKSVLLCCDILLVSCYFILFYYERSKETDYFHWLAYIISALSLTDIILYVVSPPGQRHIFFVSAIHEGIISGLGVLILCYYLLKKWNRWFFILLVLNLGGIFISQSKAAYIGTVIFLLLMILGQKKRLVPFLVLFVILTFVIPNPIRSMFYYSLKKDPYVLNRIDIWKMSWRIFQDHLLTGVGLDNFSEVSGQYNFKQTRGPANYGKVPRLPHSDYLKLMAELGLWGLLIILLLFYFLAKKIFSAGLLKIPVILLLYLLFQALLFNILFNPFFLFVLLFLLRNTLVEEPDVTYRSFSPRLKLFLASLLVFVWLVGYLFPWFAGTFLKKAQESRHPVQAFDALKKAEYLNPLDQNVYYLEALSLYRYFKQTSDLEAFAAVLDNLGKVEHLNRYFINAYLLEADLYLELLAKGIKYSSMDKEILAPLEKAEKVAPVNPFIKLSKARVYFEFNQQDRARQEAINAITLEPEYVAALFFLQEHFNWSQDEKIFRDKIAAILKKAGKLNPEPGHYLYRLYQVPGKSSRGPHPGSRKEGR